ncbi:MAG: hypothetical protein AB9869_01785 [Verrucomicrobiia bacterium]
MRIRLAAFCLICWFCSAGALAADSARILKVLPHYLDEKGRHSLSPSLYERDAYQALLRNNPEKRTALQFDVNWKARGSKKDQLLLKLELRSSGRDLSDPLVLERTVRPPRMLSAWSSLRLQGDAYRNFGQMIAWRATLWRGEEMIAELKSFLW